MGGCCGARVGQEISFERLVSKEKLGEYRTPCPSSFRPLTKEALFLSEKEKGSPVYLTEIYQYAYPRSWRPILPKDLFILALEDLYYNDEILADKDFHKYSIDPAQQHTEDNPTGMRLYSDYFAEKYPQCTVDAKLGKLNPKPGSERVNFNELKELLLSKDLSRVKELEWTHKSPSRFLDGQVDMAGNKVGLASFMRSGNSFTKKFLEAVTGITTGGEL